MREIVDQELGFAEATETPQQTAFLCIVNKRVVGMVLAEVIDTAYLLLSSSNPTSVAAASAEKRSSDQWATRPRHVTPSNKCTILFGLERSRKSSKATLGIHQMWVHMNYRNQGMARALVDAARTHMVFGYNIPVDQLAFSSPTESGVQFARRYSSRHRQHEKLSSHSPLSCQTKEEDDVLVYDCCH